MLTQEWVEFEGEDLQVLLYKTEEETEIIGILWNAIELKMLPENWLRKGMMEDIGQALYEQTTKRQGQTYD